MATSPFLALRQQPRFGRRYAPAPAPVEPAALLFFARCWLAATAFILIWVG